MVKNRDEFWKHPIEIASEKQSCKGSSSTREYRKTEYYTVACIIVSGQRRLDSERMGHREFLFIIIVYSPLFAKC